MTNVSAPAWESKRTAETRQVEEKLREAGFEQVDAYRYNPASIRVRVIDARFEGLATEERDAQIEPYLQQLPDATQADIISLLSLAPSELELTPATFRRFFLNREFDDPSPSQL